jgi:hypothetical protein
MTKPNISEVREVFNELYVPLYPKDMPLLEMTPYEQGLYKQVQNIAQALVAKMKGE